MSVKILAVGKKHEAWLSDAILRYEKRLRKPLDLSWQFVSHSSLSGELAREQESERILKALKGEKVILLDERGKIFDSPGFASKLQSFVESSSNVTFIIGGAYGVNDAVRQRADETVSLSKMVFPHQLVRLIIIEQIYRAGEILAHRGYHHE